MQYRTLGKTGFDISEISLGTWQVGGKWGEPFDHDNADRILNAAVDAGINFIDTADVYGDGESAKAVGRLVRSRSERIVVATKCGRRLQPHTSEAYQPKVLRQFVDDSLRNMGLETLDLIQLHCPPTEVYYRPEIFELFDRLKDEGKIQHLGVSVEKVEEGLKAIEYPNVTTVQIIFNMFRQRPAELFFNEAKRRQVGVIVRVPLASGLLTGKFDRNTTFSKEDHRNFNRDGAGFDKGETFSGVDYETGLAAVDALRTAFPDDTNLAPDALRWILTFDAVSCIIPGASKPEHLLSNLQAAQRPAPSPEQMAAVKSIYDERIRNPVHYLW
ncbi:aldo/keto reductase [Spirosoma utsteinense]|uniref:Aryl-alcohol dehydrogenase-like putative oxidoreductase n=1 Tax=Spirosoma utsteinense TaxID=2585773 RepID=A0ABR6WEF4_9BACT|nr:aldo/keto reductase [Spirosoma utsteinense]MBC3788962.1 aryl-alcohol dehydrogenase-like putative oxidoreductase [Spirosoma utsteinense]MBC3794912.1 aryl-alcohol dehydrogenase-like putative oxidoreductase [Spirosoma utsteinense]